MNIVYSIYTMVSIEETNVKQVYDEIAQHFNTTRSYAWEWIENFIKDNNLQQQNKKVIDIGCGNGRNLLKHFIGIDTSQPFVNMCRQKGYNVMNCDMCSIPLHSNSFDAILSIASFHHLSTTPRQIQALQEMKRLVKYNGKILLSVWSKEQPEKTRRKFEYGNVMVPWNKNGTIYQRYYYIFKVEELKKLFESVGLTIVSHIWDCGNEVFILTK